MLFNFPRPVLEGPCSLCTHSVHTHVERVACDEEAERGREEEEGENGESVEART